jgi:septum formation protein
MQIVLASKSPRRIQLLREIGLEFETYSPEFQEKTGENPSENASSPSDDAHSISLHNALGKAQEASRRFKDAIIIGVDTVGESHNHILGKPKDREDAKRLIRLISGTTHKVVSGVAIIRTHRGKPTKTLTATTETLVTMEKMQEEEIQKYIDSGEGDDKAAAYAIQGKGSLFIKKIEGDYFNVVGLPIYTIKKLLKKFKVQLI